MKVARVRQYIERYGQVFVTAGVYEQGEPEQIIDPVTGEVEEVTPLQLLSEEEVILDSTTDLEQHVTDELTTRGLL